MTPKQVATLIAAEMMEMMQEREGEMIDAGVFPDTRAGRTALYSVRLSVMDVVAVATIIATAKLTGLTTADLLDKHIKHVEQGIEKIEEAMGLG